MAATPGNGSSNRDAADRFIGVAIAGRYRIQSVIARGGVGRVYKGVQEPLGRFVAVKILDPLRVVNDTQAEAHTKRFLREATVSSRLNHPNTVVVHDYGTLDDGRLYLVMEYLEGPTLRQALQQGASLDVPRALHIARQIASSLIDAHESGVIHRDLKPPNIILVSRGGDRDFVKVVDFGLVKSIYTQDDDDLTLEGSFVGSPAYMSPEQATGQAVDQRTDIYSFGTVLYEMLAGRPPFRAVGERPQAGKLIAAHLTETPPALADVRPGPRLPMMLEALVMQCLAKSPQLRPKSMREVLSVLDQVERELGVGGAWGAVGNADRTEGGAGQPVFEVPPVPATAAHDGPSGSSTHGVAASPAAPRRRMGALVAGGALLLGLGYVGARWLDKQGAEPAPVTPPTGETAAGPASALPASGVAQGAPASPATQQAAPGQQVQASAEVPPAPAVVPVNAAPVGQPGQPQPPQPSAQAAQAAQAGQPAQAGVAGQGGTVVAPSTGPSVALAVQPPPADAPSEDVSVRIESVPPGADVLLGDEVLGTTPLSTLVERDDLEGRSWTLRLDGFKDAPAHAEAPPPSQEEVVVSVQLEAAPKTPPKRPPKVPGTKQPGGKTPHKGGSVDIQLTR